MFINYTFLFSCLAWWVQTCVLTRILKYVISKKLYNKPKRVREKPYKPSLLKISNRNKVVVVQLLCKLLSV
jgi:hypothetical protein